MTQNPELDLMELVAAARQGNRAALDELLRAILPDLRAYVRLSCGKGIRQEEESSDLVQSICREMLEGLGAFNGLAEPQFRKWLFTLSTNKIRGRHRYYTAQRRDVRKKLPLRSPASASHQDTNQEVLSCYASFCTPSQGAVAREELCRIETAYEQMPEDYRRVITMSCVTGMSHAEIAAEMGRAETAVRKLLSRARARLSLLLVTGEDAGGSSAG